MRLALVFTLDTEFFFLVPYGYRLHKVTENVTGIRIFWLWLTVSASYRKDEKRGTLAIRTETT